MSSKARDLAWLVLLGLLLYLPWVGARDLWNPNEPLYGEAVAEMHAARAWLVPTVNGAVFAEKPILYYWLALGAARLVGSVDELGLRLPSVLAGCLLLPLTYGLVWPYAGRRRALIAAVLLGTTFVVFWSARQVQMDLLLATCVLGAVLPATRALDGLARRAPAWTLSGAAAGAGFLAKGPVGLLLPALVVATYAVATGRARALAKRELLLGAAACAAVAAPWLIALALHGEAGFLRELVVRQNLLRFVEPWDHARPVWYYLVYFWVDLAPWAWLVPLAFSLPAADERERRLVRLAWSWLLSIVLFFSLAASKRSPYILPVAPAVAALAAGVIDAWLAQRLSPWRERALAQLVRVLGVLGLAAGIALVSARRWGGELPAGVIVAGRGVGLLLIAAGSLVLGASLIRGARRAVAALVLGAVALAYLATAAIALPALDAVKSSRELGTEIRARVRDHEPLCGFNEWRWRASYSFYAGRPIPNLESVEALRAYWQRPEPVFLLVERGRLGLAREVLGSVEPLVSRRVGGNEAYLFANRQAPASR